MENRCISIPERSYPWINFPDMIFRFYEALERSKDLLSRPVPDTFLGRQHHDFIPLPYQDE
jgi:hypothetical protein